MSKAQSTSSGSGFPRWLFNTLVIIIELGIAFAIYTFILGDPGNFEGGNPENHPLKGNLLGIVHKGGVIVPILMTAFMLVVTFSIERAITISRASGKKSNKIFVRELQTLVDRGQIDQAIAACDVQKGSLANVKKAGLVHYKELSADSNLDKDQKVISLQKELEEATALELPMLSQNMVILSSIVTLGTLIGLIGTVLGMIKAFQALSETSGGDSTALATGISEALINTAIGISSSTLAIITYNFFSTTIDNLTYKIDEAGFSLVQSFAASQK